MMGNSGRVIGSLLACSLMAAPSASAQDARFRITFSFMQHELQPKQRSRPVSSTYIVTLRDGKRVEERIVTQYGRRNPYTMQGSREVDIGDDLGQRTEARWKVVNGTTLVRLSARPSHTFAVWLRTDGARSCSAEIEWRLKPGHTVYETWGAGRKVRLLMSEPTQIQTACEVL